MHAPPDYTYHTIGTDLKSSSKAIERGKTDIIKNHWSFRIRYNIGVFFNTVKRNNFQQSHQY
jgi:hypothetical protein